MVACQHYREVFSFESMKYSDWNILLCEHFFSHDEGMIFLAIDKEELIDVALTSEKIRREIELIEKAKSTTINKRDYAWADFLRLFNGIKCKKQFMEAFQTEISRTTTWSKSEEKRPTIFPYLALIFIALTSDSDKVDFSFYPKVNALLKKLGIFKHNDALNTPDFTSLMPSLSMMWLSISEWASYNGFNFVSKYHHTDTFNKYVEPFIGEVLFPFNRRELLKSLFIQSGLTPDEEISDKRILSIFEDKYYRLGLTKSKMKIWLTDYELALTSEFRKIYSRWDGTARIEKRNTETSRTEYTYDGSIFKFYLSFKMERNRPIFSLIPFMGSSDSSEDYTFFNKRNKDEIYQFYIRSNGFASKPYRNSTQILDCLSTNSRLDFVDEDDLNSHLIFNPDEIFLFEKSYDSYISKCAFTKGASYFVLIQNCALDKYKDWLYKNNAIPKTLGSILDNSYSLFFIESAVESLTDNNKLTFKTTISTTLTNTFVISKDGGLYQVPIDFPIFFNITGVDVKSDNIKAVSVPNGKGNLYSFPLNFNENTQLWEFPVIKNVFAKEREYQIFCNDTLISHSRFKFIPFKLPLTYDEICFDKFGNLTDNSPLVRGLHICDTTNVGVNMEMLKFNMSNFGEPPISSQRKYKPTDYLLYCLSSNLRLNMSDIKDIISVLLANNIIEESETANKYQLYTVLDYCFAMGYINYAFVEGKYRISINRPTILWLPPSFDKRRVGNTSMWTTNSTENTFKFLLSGARTPEFVDKFIKICNSNCVIVDIQQPENNLLPQRILLWSKDISNIKKVAEVAKIDFQPCIYASALLRRLGSISEYEQFITQTISEHFYNNVRSFKRIDYKKLQKAFEQKGGYISDSSIISAEIDENKDIVTYFPKTYNEDTIYWKDGEQYSVDKHWGHLLGASIADAKIVRFNSDTCSITMPNQIKLPLLYRRALTLITAEPQYNSNGNNSYRLNLNPFAGKIEPQEILSKLNQNHE